MKSAPKSISKEVEQRILSSGLVPKSFEAFRNIIAACDFLQVQEIEITPTTVGNITGGKKGGPQVQSIRNNDDFSAYIEARRADQGKPKIKDTIQQKRLRTGDNAIDAYIQTLESELAHEKAKSRSLRQAIPSLGDFDLKTALTQGTLALAAPLPTAINHEAKEAIKALFNPERLAAVGMELMQTGQVISREHLNQVFLNKQMVSALKALLD